MGKRARDRDLPDNEAKAVARMLRVSPQKLNLVAQLIRGKKVAMALADLTFSQKRIAKEVKKCLESAIANAENNHDLDVDELVVAEAHVGKALVLKRFHPRGRGRMGKSARERDLPDNEAKAVARMLRVSPQKLNLVAQLIRGKKVATALSDLQFSQKRIATEVKKCLESAIANAENNHDLDVDELVVAEAFVGKALVLKRFHPRGRGRMGKILKPFSNLTIVVRQVQSEAA